jgi:glycosyltransferase involved in cell wall biosynthesis
MLETPYQLKQSWDSSSPPVDVVIPTLNCKSNLVRCLERLRAQDYRGDTRIVVVDGGSTDGTVDVALRFGCDLIARPGIYGTGLTGARHLGESSGNAPLVWLVDSDNFIKEDEAEAALVRPLVEDPNISFSVPLPYVDRDMNSFNQWLNMFERELVVTSAREGIRM